MTTKQEPSQAAMRAAQAICGHIGADPSEPRHQKKLNELATIIDAEFKSPAAPRNSEVARLNGLGSNPKADTYRFIKPELLKRVQEMPRKESMLNELTRLREENERLKEDLDYAKKGMASNSRIMLGACKLLHASGIECGSKAICDAMREIREMQEANREQREALESLMNEYNDREAHFGESRLWVKHEDVEILDRARKTINKYKP